VSYPVGDKLTGHVVFASAIFVLLCFWLCLFVCLFVFAIFLLSVMQKTIPKGKLLLKIFSTKIYSTIGIFSLYLLMMRPLARIYCKLTLSFSLQVINHLTLAVSENSLDFEQVDMYTVNVS